MFPDTFEYWKCLETGEMTKSLHVESVQKQENDKILWLTQIRHSRWAPNGLLEYGRGVTEYGKCLETGKRQNPLMMQNRSAQGALNDLEYGRGVTENEKCLETGKRQNPLMVQNRSAQGAPTDLLDV